MVLFLEQWKKRARRPAGVLGMAGAAALALFGADNLVIPAMALILVLLVVLRSRLDRGPRRGGGVMTLTPIQTLGIILAVAAGTQLTRWLPFWLFPEKRDPPPVVAYLGRVLPPAMMGLLVVYCPEKRPMDRGAPRRAGADRRGRHRRPPLVARQCAGVHCRRYGGVHAAGAAGICVEIQTARTKVRAVSAGMRFAVCTDDLALRKYALLGCINLPDSA